MVTTAKCCLALLLTLFTDLLWRRRLYIWPEITGRVCLQALFLYIQSDFLLQALPLCKASACMPTSLHGHVLQQSTLACTHSCRMCSSTYSAVSASTARGPLIASYSCEWQPCSGYGNSLPAAWSELNILQK